MRKVAFILLTAFIATACSSNSTTVNYEGGKVRLTAVSEKIIRVEAVPSGAEFSTAQSLSVIAQSAKCKLNVKKGDGEIVATTGQVTAKVNTATGQVSFFDAGGNPVVSEDRREFTPIEVEGTKGWTVRQVFNSDDDEGFYGLGQHQADEWNYKGRNEELYQYNTKISIPFIVSSKKYGILWESTSFCRWGDPRDYKQLGEVFKLYDKKGEEGALTGSYYPAKGGPLIRRETALNQEYLRTPECDIVMNSPQGFDFNGSHVVFEGAIEPAESGLFHFYMYYAGYTKVFVNGKQVMPDLWRTAWNPNGRKFEYNLESGQKASLRIEWEPDGGTSYCALKVLPPVDRKEQGKMSWWGEMQDEIDYYYIAADDIDGVISGYRTLTGKAPVLPKWTLGYWQSRERYTSQEQILSVMKEFRDKQIPIDNIVQDWQYWKADQWGSHEFDETRFPDPKGMVDSIHALNGRYMISVWPKFYEGTEHFNELDSKGWIYRTAIDEKVIDWLGFSQSFYDAYSADARKLFWQQMYDHLYPIGVDSWWMDASEPNIHDCTDMDYRKKMAGPTAMGPSTKYLNAYALLNAEAIYNGQRSVDPDRRVFLLTRNGFTGLQRYSTASWSGDISTTWLDMKAQISAGLNYCISGLPFWGQDIGGFTSEFRFQKAQELFDKTGKVTEDLKEWRELNARWHEWGVFCPLYRAHGQYPLREPWNIAPAGSETYNAILAVDRMRYRLMPYIYTLAARIHFEDYTMMRPLVMDFTDDAVARDISDQFMFGDAVMVCPVYEYGARSREVYLPEGGWYDLSNGKFINGGSRFTAQAPYERIPLYARAGQIVVSGDDIQSTADIQKDLYINIFGGDDAKFSLYEDDGLTYNYEKGDYATVTFTWNDAGKCLKVSAVEGNASVAPAQREFRIRLFTPEGTETATVRYDGNATEITL